jgi:hypothetical protein
MAIPALRLSTPRCVARGLALGCALLALLAAGPAGATGTFSVVAKTGDPLPGMPGFSIQAVGPGLFGPADRLVLSVTLVGPGVTPDDDASIWLEDENGVLELAFRQGDEPPGLPGTGYSFIDGRFRPGPPGEVIFYTHLWGATPDDDKALFASEAGGAVSVVVREGDPAPLAGPGVTWGCCFNQLQSDSSGRISFPGMLLGTENGPLDDEALWIRDPDGTLVMRARGGDPAPGTPEGVVFASLDSGGELGGTGRISFTARTISPSAPQYPYYPDGSGLWTAPSSTAPLEAVLLTGDPAPSGVPGETIVALWTNDGGANAEALIGNLRIAGPSVTADNDDSVFASDGAGGFRLLVREGDPAPGADGAFFGHTSIEPFSPSVINDAREAVIQSRLEGPSVSGSNDFGLWLADPDGQVSLLVRKGSLLADRPDFRVTTMTITPPLLNERGDVAFVATLLATGPPVPIVSQPAILVRLAGTAGVQMLVRVGERLAVAPGDFRTVQSLGLGSLADDGSLTFSAVFTDSTSASFRASLAEPACSDGEDDDGDGLVDLDDTGCRDALDVSENEAPLPCDDGIENDNDGRMDYPEDPGCKSPTWTVENPQCQDGRNNDHQTGIDFDGGASRNGGVPRDVPDPQCTYAWQTREAAGSACGLGFELALLLPLLWARRRPRRA